MLGLWAYLMEFFFRKCVDTPMRLKVRYLVGAGLAMWMLSMPERLCLLARNKSEENGAFFSPSVGSPRGHDAPYPKRANTMHNPIHLDGCRPAYATD